MQNPPKSVDEMSAEHNRSVDEMVAKHNRRADEMGAKQNRSVDEMGAEKRKFQEKALKRGFVFYALSMVLALAFGACGPAENKDDDENNMLIEAELRVDVESLHFALEANQTKTLNIFSNTDWSLSTNGADWLSVAPSSGKGNATVEVKVLVANTDTALRSADLEITAGKLQKTVLITQAATEPMLSVSSTSLDFDAEAGSETFMLQSNTAWSASCSETWCTVDMPSGSGNRTVTVSVSANGSTDDRYATVEITAGLAEPVTVSIMQRAFNSELSVNPAQIVLTSGAAASREFNVISNTSWIASCSRDWCRVEPTSGSNNGRVTVTLTQNNGTTPRYADVSVTATTDSTNIKTVSITQPPIMPTITSFTPTQTGYGAEMLISGSNFSDVRAANVVRLGEVEVPAANIDSVSPTAIRLTVPSSSLCRVNAVSRCTGRVQVTVDGNKTVTSTSNFTYVLTGTVSTLAGNGTVGSAEGTGSAARFNGPSGIAIDPTYGVLYVADTHNHRIRLVTPGGEVRALTAGHSYPRGVAMTAPDALYVANSGHNRIHRHVPSYASCQYIPFIAHCPLLSVSIIAGSTTEGFADATGTSALFAQPYDIARDSSGNLYVADTHNHCIRRISTSNVVTTLAGNCRNAGFADGTGSAARFSYPQGITVDASGNLYVTDPGNQRIRRVVISTGAVTTLAGGTAGFADGTGTAARFSNPVGITRDSAGNLYVTDANNNRIRRITPAGVVTTIAGTNTRGFVNGAGSLAQFYYPWGIAIDAAANNLYVADYSNSSIRRIVLEK
ncbi:MAG: IPT/TIG domain-containing protein [Cystobacterineae bacterium]|nr:IPT/TIG domain-containing protein [Cystobacterineae bacterium]